MTTYTSPLVAIGIGSLFILVFYFSIFREKKHDRTNNNAGTETSGIASEKEGKASGQQEQKET